MSTPTSILTSYVIPTAEGIRDGNIMTTCKQMEDTFRQGRNKGTVALLQIQQLHCSMGQVSSALKATNRPELHWGARWACILTPAMIAIASRQGFANMTVRRIINFAHDHIGTLAHVVSVVALTVLFVQGQVIFASVSLVYLGIGLLARKHILPERMRQIIFRSGFVVGNLTALILGDPVSKVFALLDIAIIVGNKWMEHRNRQNPVVLEPQVQHEQVAPVLVSSEQFKKGINGSAPIETLRVAVNKGHVNLNVLPEVPPEITVDTLKELCDNFPWERHKRVYMTKLESDPRWTEIAKPGDPRSTLQRIKDLFSRIFSCCKTQRHPAATEPQTPPELDQDGKGVQFIKAQMKKFVDSIKNRRITEGEPADYSLLQYYLRFIAQKLPEEKEMYQADIMLRLAVEGGEYCGPGKFRVASEAYQDVISSAGSIPLKIRILNALQLERRRQFDIIYNYLWQAPTMGPFKYIIDPTDIHTYNQFMLLIGPEFGLPKNGADQDNTAGVDATTKFIYAKMMPIFRDLFWKGKTVSTTTLERRPDTPWWKIWKRYHRVQKETVFPGNTPDRINEVVRNIIGKGQAPKDDFYDWAKEWINRQPISPEEKEKLRKSIAGEGEISSETTINVTLLEMLRNEVEKEQPNLSEEDKKKALQEMCHAVAKENPDIVPPHIHDIRMEYADNKGKHWITSPVRKTALLEWGVLREATRADLVTEKDPTSDLAYSEIYD